MNKILAALSLRISVFLALLLMAVPVESGSILKIDIDGFETNKGLARIVLFSSREGYKGTVPPFRIDSVPIRQGRANWTITDLPLGTYAAIVHHDENANNELDRPYFSLPLERYGFSNNKFKTFGIPEYELVKFTLGAGSNAQNITIQYNPLAAAIVSMSPFRNLFVLTLALLFPFIFISPLRRWLGSWASDTKLLGRFGLTLFLLLTSSAHFTSAARMMLMLPDWVPERLLIIYATGVLEILLGVLLWVPGWVQRSGLVLAIMLVLFLPANIYAAMNHLPFGGNEMGPSYLFVRVPYQILLVMWTAWITELTYKSYN